MMKGVERVAEIIAGLAMSHSPMIMTSAEAGGEKGKRFIQTLSDMKKWLEDSGTDILVIVSDDHFNSYFYDHMPSFTIGIDKCEGWGDWQLPKYKIPVEKELAKHILTKSLERNIDFTFTMSMKVDHGHTQAIYFLNSELNIPVVPIAVNTAAPPLPTLDRCFQLGEALRSAIESWPSDKKISIVASGGISHWVPIPKIESTKPEDQELIQVLVNGRQEIKRLDEYLKIRETRVTSIKSGPVNETWDREFLNLIKEGKIAALRKWSAEDIEENGGNGGQEIRNWLVLLGAIPSFTAEVSFYEPIPEWVTGMAIVQFSKKVLKEQAENSREQIIQS